MNRGVILIVDDEARMRDLVKIYLNREGFQIIEAEDGEQALKLVEQEKVDLVLLDIMMPKIDGFYFCMKVRETSNIPIIFLTARGDEWDRVHGLKIGGDDYVVKPFSSEELTARIEAVLRRSGVSLSPKEQSHQIYGLIEINEKGRQVKVGGKAITLTLKEFELLLFLIEHSGQALTREQLLEHVWGYDYIGSPRTVDTHVKTLRLKLRGASEYVQTVWGIGYKFEVT
ncbi:response regulator transcription factor [Bacillus solimangrovi]|uniref:DNA-binding response regulator n=1 Tax=Bacillus solimangrovi TaxID=1305675 RepID=A0A1E5LIW8_9BACI|nr:response regulator transcription factor [Bacillus solimangrovi]OEH94024.1 DNA-binding response regulator [Bacillus solimangrovi]